MTRTSDTVRTHLQRCRTLVEGLLKLCSHQSPYTGRTHRLFPPPQAASVRPSFEPTATPPSRATSRGCYRYANPPPLCMGACVSSCVRECMLAYAHACVCACVYVWVYVYVFACACVCVCGCACVCVLE